MRKTRLNLFFLGLLWGTKAVTLLPQLKVLYRTGRADRINADSVSCLSMHNFQHANMFPLNFFFKQESSS